MRATRPLVMGVVLLLGLAGFSTVAPVAAAAPTSISIRADHGAVRPGATATIVGYLYVPDGAASGRPLSLEAKATGEPDFTPVGAAMTSATGGVRLLVQPEMTTRYRLRYAGAEDAGAEVSGVVLVRVRASGPAGRRAPTSISIRAVKPAVLAGVATSIRGRLRATPQAALGRQRLVLLAKSAGADTWQFHDARRTDRAGQVNFLIRPRTHTSYRLAFAGASGFRPSRSGVADVRMRPVVTIAADKVQLDAAENTTVYVTVTGESGPVVGVTVELLEREPPGSGAKWVVVGSIRTGADGTAHVVLGPGASTSYRWRSNPIGDVPAGRSPPLYIEVRSPSALSIRGGRTGEGFVVVGRLMAENRPVSAAEVTLQSYDAATSTWKVVATGPTGGEGRVRFVQPIVPGASYRLVYDGPRFASSTSATLTT